MPVPTSPVRPVLTTVCCARTWFSARHLLLLIGTFAGLIAVAITPFAWPITGRVVLAGLRATAAEPDCASPVRRWSGLVRGASAACDTSLVQGRRTRWMLERVARTRSYPAPARLMALRELAASGASTVGVRAALLSGTPSDPAFRRDVLAVLDGAPGGADADDLVRRLGPHGITDSGLFALFARGEPDTAVEVSEALAAFGSHLDPRSRAMVLAGLGLDATEVRRGRFRGFPGQTTAAYGVACVDTCDARIAALARGLAASRNESPPPPAAHIPVANDILDLVVDGDAANHLRIEFAQIAAWISEVGGSVRVTRLLNASAHAARDGAAVRGSRRGDLHATLRGGGGTPGTAAFATGILSVASGIPVRVWRTPQGVVIEAEGELRAVTACSAPRRTDRPPRDAVLLHAESTTALFLLEASAAALRRGELARANELRTKATALSVADQDVLARDLSFLHADLLAAAGEAEPAIRALNEGAAAPDDIGRTAWWGAAYGHRDVARTLAPAGGGDLMAAALILSGEPTAPTGPWSSRIAGKHSALEGPCREPFRAWP